jgi:hypothetical protein
MRHKNKRSKFGMFLGSHSLVRGVVSKLKLEWMKMKILRLVLNLLDVKVKMKLPT